MGNTAALTNLCGLFVFFFSSVYLSVLCKYYFTTVFHIFPVIHRLSSGCVSQPLGSNFQVSFSVRCRRTNARRERFEKR